MSWIPFRLHSQRVQLNTSQQIETLEVSLEAADCEGDIWITDIMLQGGPVSTVWQGHPSELRWTDEYK